MPRPKIPDRLELGGSLQLKQFLQSPNGKYRLGLRDDSARRGYTEFVLWEGDIVVWSGNIENYADNINMMANGNVLLRDQSGQHAWNSRTRQVNPSPDTCLQVLDEGVAVIKAAGVVRWSSDQDKFPATEFVPSEWTTSVNVGENKFKVGQYLSPDHHISSPNKQYSAIFQASGELELIQNSTKQVIWSFKVADGPLSKLCLGYNYKFHVVDTEVKEVKTINLLVPKLPDEQQGRYGDWSSITLHDDGFLWLDQIKGNPEWFRPNRNYQLMSGIWLPASKGKIDHLKPGQCLASDQTIQFTRDTDKAEVTAGFTTAGDLFVAISGKKTYFYTEVPKGSGYAVLLQLTRDEVALLGERGKVLWSAKYTEPRGMRLRDAEENNPPKLCVDVYGDLVVTYNNKALWSSESLKSGDQPSA